VKDSGNQHTIKLHADGDITRNTHYSVKDFTLWFSLPCTVMKIKSRLRYTGHTAFMGEIYCSKIKVEKPYDKIPFK
jgi:hypothetical protein